MRRPRSDNTFAAAPPPLGYRPALDGLRAVSVLCVVGFHNAVLPGGGFLGVDIFFVLSGFLITNLLLAERAATGRLDLLRFYARRARRLVPPLVVAVAGFLAIKAVTDRDGFATDLFAAVAGVTYVSNIFAAITPQWVDGVGQLWSLAAEEQFYLLWPLALVAAVAARISRRTLTVTLALVVAAIWANRLGLALTGASQQRLYFAPDTSLDPIVLGCLLALLHDGGHVERAFRSGLVRRGLVPALGAVVVGLIVSIPDAEPRWVYEWGLPVFNVAVTVVLAAIIVDPRCIFSGMLERRRLVALGRISYGVYLWHPILLYAAHLPRLPSAAAAIGVAALSNRYVERRFLRKPKVPLPPVPGAAAASPA